MPFGEHSRGYLPHVDQPNLCQSITFRLADAIPAKVVTAWKNKLKDENDSNREARLRGLIDAYEDIGHGACLLRKKQLASIVAHELTMDADIAYRLYAWVVMPNHIHVLLGPLPDSGRLDLSAITRRWKGRSARQINTTLGRTGQLWQRESFDRWIRDTDHFQRVGWYIEANPMKAGLKDWQWGSRNFIAPAG